MKACVNVGEPAETLPLPLTYSTLRISCAHETEDMRNGGAPTSHWRLDWKPKFPLILGSLYPLKPGVSQPLWTLTILLLKGIGEMLAIAPVDTFSSWGPCWIPSRVSFGWTKGYLLEYHFEAGEPAGEIVRFSSHQYFLFFFGSWAF